MSEDLKPENPYAYPSWGITLNKYQRDNLLSVILMAGYPYQQRDGWLVEPLGALNTGDWLGEVFLMLTAFSADLDDLRPNVRPDEMRKRIREHQRRVLRPEEFFELPVEERLTRPWPYPLRVWWVPQIPMKAFYVEARTAQDAINTMDTLSRYDQFQLDNNVKPDYCNAGGIAQYEGSVEPNDDGWYDVDDEEVFGRWA